MRPRIKFCGITDAEDANAAAALGADALGFIFHPPAKTAMTAAAVRDIISTLPPFVITVAVFFNSDAATVKNIIDTTAVDRLQFHGDETADFCRQFSLPYIKTCRIQQAEDIAATAGAHPHCRALLVDTYQPDLPGGTGKTFDWNLLKNSNTGDTDGDTKKQPPLIIAGGLTADNVGELIRRAQPDGVDVAGGISEADSPRRKNYAKMKSFIRAVNRAGDTDYEQPV